MTVLFIIACREIKYYWLTKKETLSVLTKFYLLFHFFCFKLLLMGSYLSTLGPTYSPHLMAKSYWEIFNTYFGELMQWMRWKFVFIVVGLLHKEITCLYSLFLKQCKSLMKSCFISISKLGDLIWLPQTRWTNYGLMRSSLELHCIL